MSNPSSFEQLLRLMGPSVQHHFLYANGIRTSYIEGGAGPVLVLLHGAGGGAANWYKVIPKLVKDFRVVAFDKPGYGESEKPFAAYDKAFYYRWLAAAVDTLKLDTFSLLGSSQGGAVALQFAIKQGERLQRLILAGSAGLGDNPAGLVVLQMALYRLLPYPFWGDLLGSSVMKDPSHGHPAWHDYSREVIRKKGGRYPFFLGRGKSVLTFTDEELRSVTVPTLLLWGEEEAFFPVVHAERALALLPDAQLEALPAAGHLPFMEQPDLFCQLVRQFILANH